MLDLKKQNLLVIAPHPDDEVVGCGGLIKRVKDAGGKVYVLFLTVGDTKDFSKKGVSFGKEREREIETVAKFLKFDDYHLAFNGNSYHLKLDTLGQKTIMDAIERESRIALEKIKPSIVAFPSTSSYNQDHRIAAEAAHAALRPADGRDKHFVKTVLAYEEPSDSWALKERAEVNFFAELTKKDLDAKVKAMNLYMSQVREGFNSRSTPALKNLAYFRGFQSGVEIAEGFFNYRLVF